MDQEQDEYGNDILQIGGLRPQPRSIGGLAYVPDLAPMGSGSSYWPRDTKADAQALNYLGYYPDPLLAAHVGTSGSQKADMAANTGAWDPSFRTAVTDFQDAAGLEPDGWVGVKTRTALAAAVAAKNANGGAPIPDVVPDILPNGGGSAQPVSTKTGSNTGLILAGLGTAAALGLWWFLSD